MIIGDHVFHGCSSLINIEIPDSVGGLWEDAFFGCSSLKSIVIPASMQVIGNWPFTGCSSLTNITYAGTMAQWKNILIFNPNDGDPAVDKIHCTDGDIDLTT